MSPPALPTLRPALPSDIEFAYHVWKAAMKGYVEATWGWDEAWQQQRQKQEFAEKAYRIIESEGVPVGTLIVESHPDHLYLSGLYLLPEHQGKGIGSWVLDKVIADAVRQELPLRLRVLQVNTRARRLYERKGFLVLDETEPGFLVMTTPPPDR
jgi:ribosomal protein S18 acetylase RimI-like enzyme